MTDWKPAATLSALQEKGRCLARLGVADVALFCVDEKIYAIEDACPHSGASLCMGPLNGLQVQCRAHGLKFDLRTGAMPGVNGLQARVFPIRVVDGQVEVDVALPVEPAA